MDQITIFKSTVSGLHVTKKGSHPEIKLSVLPDPSRRHHDPNCFKVVAPTLEDIPVGLHGEVVWPKNPSSRRYADVLVRDIAGTKIGHVPANLCGLFKR